MEILRSRLKRFKIRFSRNCKRLKNFCREIFFHFIFEKDFSLVLASFQVNRKSIFRVSTKLGQLRPGYPDTGDNYRTTISRAPPIKTFHRSLSSSTVYRSRFPSRVKREPPFRARRQLFNSSPYEKPPTPPHSLLPRVVSFVFARSLLDYHTSDTHFGRIPRSLFFLEFEIIAEIGNYFF